MKFLLDAQLPRILITIMERNGHQAMHTLDLPDGNRTKDSAVLDYADSIGAVLLTKDKDFMISKALHDKPARLLLVATGNIGNHALITLIESHLDTIVIALTEPGVVELSRASGLSYPTKAGL